MIDDRGGYVWTAPDAAQIRRETVIVRWVVAAVAVMVSVVVVALMILWVDGRHHRAIRNGRPLPAHTTPHTPEPAPGPPPGIHERMLRLGDAPVPYLPPPPWLPAATVEQIGNRWLAWAAAR